MVSGEENSRYARKIEDLLSQGECEWIEFKKDNDDPKEIGEYISALSNSAALLNKAKSYLIWGIEDTKRKICGTAFDPKSTKKGNEELENWLARSLKPRVHFRFETIHYEEKKIVILEIDRAHSNPIRFQSTGFIRIGSYKKKLIDYPEKERVLWKILDGLSFEKGVASENVDEEDVLKLLDYKEFFTLLKIHVPDDEPTIRDYLEKKQLISNDDGSWNIYNLGAILFAGDIRNFPSIERKKIRVVFYVGVDRTQTDYEQEGAKGYAAGFNGLIKYLIRRLPNREILEGGRRKSTPMFPQLAIRELVANALIHQDFDVSGDGPMIEVFSDRIEVRNPGTPQIKTERFVDSIGSRNESLSQFMRHIGLCEERGSGIDKVIHQTEINRLPAPLFEVSEHHTTAVLFAYKELNEMDAEDKIRACYYHCCLNYVKHRETTNSSIRDRFGILAKNASDASRIIKMTKEKGLIKPIDEDASKKFMSYKPFWA